MQNSGLSAGDLQWTRYFLALRSLELGGGAFDLDCMCLCEWVGRVRKYCCYY